MASTDQTNKQTNKQNLGGLLDGGGNCGQPTLTNEILVVFLIAVATVANRHCSCLLGACGRTCKASLTPSIKRSNGGSNKQILLGLSNSSGSRSSSQLDQWINHSSRQANKVLVIDRNSDSGHSSCCSSHLARFKPTAPAAFKSLLRSSKLFLNVDGNSGANSSASKC